MQREWRFSEDRVRTMVAEFQPRHRRQKYCSRHCALLHSRKAGPDPSAWKVVRPAYEQLTRELAETNRSAVGRKYGVSDNAVRKWVRAYERQNATAD